MSRQQQYSPNVIDLVSSSDNDDDDDEEEEEEEESTVKTPPPSPVPLQGRQRRNRTKKHPNLPCSREGKVPPKEKEKSPFLPTIVHEKKRCKNGQDANNNNNNNNSKANHKRARQSNSVPPPQPTTTTASFVLEQDLAPTLLDSQEEDPLLVAFRQAQALQPRLLYYDQAFGCQPSSIRGTKAMAKQQSSSIYQAPPCHCRGGGGGGGRRTAKLSFAQARNTNTTNNNNNNNNIKRNSQCQPIYTCTACKFFQPALTAERMHWYRFGPHTGHGLVDSQLSFRAQDLCQGKVGDCWFLSALAVIAERSDLIQRLFPQTELSEDGVVQVRLFLDGYWKIVTMDNFLPCIIHYDEQEEELQAALRVSLGQPNAASSNMLLPPVEQSAPSSSSVDDPFALADACRATLQETHEYLERQYRQITGRIPPFYSFSSSKYLQLRRPVMSADLAYSKAANNQLWVPFIEKAYAKSHGCYQGISGGHIAEAFLDLTGAPTAVHDLHTDPNFNAKSFWYRLLQYRKQRLPMGCGTSSSAVGIIGRHAYSILDVQEVKNVDFRFFQETGVAHGNVSGFTEYDGTVRLLRIRNPHGQGEWKGDFSDRSETWEKLLKHSGNSNLLERTMRNDGQFWIDYDNFLMAFSNVDVVLSFLGNHGKSFASNFPAKMSNHRCARAFEVSLVEHQPGVCRKDTVEIYVMGIQKTRRGARHGRTDRKVSYKVTDLGMMVGEGCQNDENSGISRFARVSGQMFGFNRNGHKKLILDRLSAPKLVIMPVSFGHPAASDKELPFVLRFVSDAPLIIRELDSVPRMDAVMEQYCLAPKSHMTGQGIHKILLEEESLFRIFQVDCRASGGGIVMLHLCVNEMELEKQDLKNDGISFSIQANCRGMSARTEKGLLQHETIAKGKKFEAAWRRYSSEFIGETKSRVLLVLYQSGQDTEFGGITCKRTAKPRKLGYRSSKNPMDDFVGIPPQDEYNIRGIFNPPKNSRAYYLSNSLEANDVPAMFLDDHDEQLERALAESRGDVMLQQTLEQSLRVDGDLQQALILSKKTIYLPVDDLNRDIRSQASWAQSGSYDDDISTAIKLSLESHQMKQTGLPTQSNDSKPTIFDLTEEDDTAGTKTGSTAATVAAGTSTIDDKKPSSLAEKRGLAAEAAMKRFERR